MTTFKHSNGPAEDMARALRRLHVREKNQVIETYLCQHSQAYRELDEVRERGWKNNEGDRYFKKQRENADNANEQNRKFFFEMMKVIAKGMDQETGAFEIGRAAGVSSGATPPSDNDTAGTGTGTGWHRANWREREVTAGGADGTVAIHPRVLDLCMAPGGYIAYLLTKYPHAKVRAFTLPVEMGGHQVFLESGEAAVELTWTDVTMLAADMGVVREEDMPPAHSDADKFELQKMLGDAEDDKFDVVFCDGQVLRTHTRSAWRDVREARRLTLTQLALGLEHVKSGGTMVILLHKVEALDNWLFIELFDEISNLKLFKHKTRHATRSSFYLVAKNVRAGELKAVEAVERWKRQWKVMTFGTDEECQAASEAEKEHVPELLQRFGPRLIELGNPIWERQKAALKNTTWAGSRGGLHEVPKKSDD